MVGEEGGKKLESTRHWESTGIFLSSRRDDILPRGYYVMWVHLSMTSIPLCDVPYFVESELHDLTFNTIFCNTSPLRG